MDQAMEFHALPAEVRARELARVMDESMREFSHKEVARRYIEIYEDMLERPLVETESGEAIKAIADAVAQSAGSGEQKPGQV
jgi:hypothetical protein